MTGVDDLSNEELMDLIRKRNEAKRIEEFNARRCFKCDRTNEANEWDGYGPLTDIAITVADGEEGYSNLTRYMCNEHLIEVSNTLVALGLGLHVHGGICFLEIQDCPGRKDMDACPTPEEQYP